MKTVLITGASTGIGRAASEYLVVQGWKVFAGVRKQADADALSAANEQITPLILDVTDQASIDAAISRISGALEGETLTGLVNNAGIANMGPLALQSMDEVRAHYEVNVFGLLDKKAHTVVFAVLVNREFASGQRLKGNIVLLRVDKPFVVGVRSGALSGF